MKAYVMRAGNKWCIRIQTPSGVWRTLDYWATTEQTAIDDLLTLGYERVDNAKQG